MQSEEKPAPINKAYLNASFDPSFVNHAGVKLFREVIEKLTNLWDLVVQNRAK